MNNQNLSVGTHIKTSRGLYEHHGILCDDDVVIHYAGFAQPFKKGAIEVTDLDTFLGDATTFKVVNYPSSEVQYVGYEVVERAFSRLGEDNYNLIFNNCESFACWCITGKSKSEQVDSVMRHTTTTIISYSLIRSIGTATTVETAKRLLTTSALSSVVPSTTTSLTSTAVGAVVGGGTGLAASAVLGGGAAAALGTTVAGGVGLIGASAVTAAAAPVVVPLVVIGAIGGALWSIFD